MTALAGSMTHGQAQQTEVDPQQTLLKYDALRS